VAACGGPRVRSKVTRSTGKVSNDPHFVEKLHDGVGLNLNPPERAVVFAVDEKSQIQALDRTQPGLPLRKGRAGTMTHDHKRHGTTTLFAELDVATGAIIHDCMDRNRHIEFLRFLRTVEARVEPELRSTSLPITWQPTNTRG
jgi:hypothetical protein